MKSATPSSSLASARSDAHVVPLLPVRALPTSDPALELVRRALAAHLGIAAEEIDESQDLEQGLGLDPLDLVLVALRLEDLGEVLIEFPVADLAGVATVADLTAMVRRWWQGPPVSAYRWRRPSRR